jgi:hypothetical protein
VADSGKGCYLVSYTVPQAGLYRLSVTSGARSLGSSPYSLCASPPADCGSDEATPLSPSPAAMPDDLARRWGAIAASAFREVDGDERGFESDEERRETAEEKYEREHPEVPIVRNLEDMWMVAKMENLKKKRAKEKAWRAEREARMAKAAAAAATTTEEEAAAAAGGG